MAGRPCTVCGHPKRREIERRAARGDTSGSISSDYDVSERAIQRHLATHAIRSMEKAAIASGARDLASGLGLNEEAVSQLERSVRLLDRADEMLRGAETVDELAAITPLIREARGNLELLGRFTGKLGPDATVNVVQAVKVTLRIGGSGVALPGDPDAS